MANPNALRKEQKKFDAQLDELLVEHEEQWVLFQDGKPVDFFGDHESAYAAGLDRFGSDASFLVVQVKASSPQPVSVAWDAGVMFG